MRNRERLFVLSIIAVCGGVFLLAHSASQKVIDTYENIRGALVTDRTGIPLIQKTTADGQRPLYQEEYPPALINLLIEKEDRFFWYHPGVNPVSMVRAAATLLVDGTARGSSTITQQLVKVLRETTDNHSIGARIVEIFYALALEARLSKKEILTMYLNSVFLGRNARGFAQASYEYFGAPVETLSEEELLRLIATISRPTAENPSKAENLERTQLLGEALQVDVFETELSWKGRSTAAFELQALPITCTSRCALTIDADLTEKLRIALAQGLSNGTETGATHGAIVVIQTPSNEILAVVGSPYPENTSGDFQINMAIEPRPIGSTIKPFIYARGFDKGLRPYTKVVDREYKYPLGSGFSIYPKNFDGIYHGEVTLHDALANSLNVPSVKTLEFIGLQDFYELLSKEFSLVSVSPLESYAYGIALGGLETDLLTLTHFFTVFPNNGVLRPLSIGGELRSINAPHAVIESKRRVFSVEATELVTKILSDRETGVAQFGLRSNLNVHDPNVAVKTGTSRDFHDSWTVGYTPDFVVGVWVGNAENRPMRNVTGAVGAGQIWKRTMDILLSSPYRTEQTFSFKHVTSYENAEGTVVYGLPGDRFDEQERLLLSRSLIESPHDGDDILLEDTTVIPLESSHDATWMINGTPLGTGNHIVWRPKKSGIYLVTASEGSFEETISVRLLDQPDPIPSP